MPKMMNSKQVTETLEKAAVQGALTCAATSLIYPVNGQVSTPLGSVPLCYVSAGLGAATSVTNDLLHNYVFSEIPVNKKVKNDVSLIVSLVSSGLMFNLGMSLIHEDLVKEFGMWKGLAIGSGTELASGLVLDMLR